MIEGSLEEWHGRVSRGNMEVAANGHPGVR
jgi:hypothetical protein